MNRRTMRLLTDGLVALVIATATSFIASPLQTLMGHLYLPLFLIPFIWLGLRYSGATAIFFSAIFAAIYIFLFTSDQTWNAKIFTIIPAIFSVGLAGLFAKYTQKTLNNRRYQSTYLNISTASVLVTFTYLLVQYILMPLVEVGLNKLSLASLDFWLSFLVVSLLASIILIVMARSQATFIIPKRSKYLSRKETSSLLND